MELADDEAYYWFCGRHLDWGSYHTPPFIPFLCKIGYSIIPNEFGLRLFYIIFHLLTLFTIEKISRPQNKLLFIGIIVSFGVLHVAGFWAAPDIPYLFFASLLIYLFDQYKKKDNLLIAFFISVTMALIMYSKYHGIIIIVALLLANPSLFKRTSFYLVGIFALVLYLPHLNWLVEHDFVSTNFHLKKRSIIGFNWKNPLNFILGLLLITGPLSGILLLPLSIGHKPKNQLQKNLKYVLISILVFFFLLSFRNIIEANWMIAALIPIIVLGYQQLDRHTKLRKWFYYSLPFSLLIAFGLRIILVTDFMPLEDYRLHKLKEFRHNREWVQALEEKANGLPIIFQSGFQTPSKYLFYSNNKLAANIAPYSTLSSHFEIVGNEKQYHGQKVMVAKFDWWENTNCIGTSRGNFFYRKIDSFCFNPHATVVPVNTSLVFNNQGKGTIDFKIYDLEYCSSNQYYIAYIIRKGEKEIINKRIQIRHEVILNDKRFKEALVLPKIKGEYQLELGLATIDFTQSYGVRNYKLVIR